jgi:hypothetical protein
LSDHVHVGVAVNVVDHDHVNDYVNALDRRPCETV